jgi:ketosteroid isomerase-like protein
MRVRRLGSADPLKFARSWIDARSRHDLDAVLSHFSDDFEFSSPIVREGGGEPSGQLVGKQALRRYWAGALDRLPDTYFDLDSVLAGVNCLTIVYGGQRGRRAEVFQLGSDGRAVRGFEQYPA